MSNLRGSPGTEAAVLEQKTKAILEEYFGLKDTAEAYLVGAQQFPPSCNFCTYPDCPLESFKLFLIV